MRQRFYVDGLRKQTTKDYPIERVRQWINNVEREWSKDGLFPLTLPGESDFNKAHTVTRISPDEIVVVTTAGKTLRWINVA